MADIEEQPLPRTFEEFNEQRKAAFIRVKDYKQAGNRLVGFLCSYTPLEIIDAAGAASVALCGTSDEVIPEAEKVLPANLCPLIKSTYGFAYSQKCPFTYFGDMIIGETTCDGKKKMYELLGELKRTYILHLPQSRDRAYEREGWYEECRLLKEELENFYGITITDDDLRAAVRRRNRLRAAQLEMFALQANQPAAMSGVDLMSTMFTGTFSFDIEAYTEQLEQKVAKLRKAYEAGERPIAADAKRILITGCPVGGVINKIGRTIESNGGVVVCMDDCSGERTAAMMIDPRRSRYPACHRRPLSGHQLLGDDAQRRPHGQYAGHVREVPRRWRGRERAAGVPHLQRGKRPYAGDRRGCGHSVHEDRDRLQQR